MGGYSTKHGQAKAQANSVETRRAQSLEHARKVGPYIREYQAMGESLNAIAETMNLGSIPPARGGNWTTTGVKRVLARLDAEGE